VAAATALGGEHLLSFFELGSTAAALSFGFGAFSGPGFGFGFGRPTRGG
jgi:hypothetical protein